MEYELKNRKRNRIQTIDDLVNLWLKVSSFQEFKLKCAIYGYYPNLLDQMSLWFYYFKNTIPFLYYSINIFGGIVSFGGALVLSAINPWHFFIAIGMISAYIFYMCRIICSDIVQQIQWHEDGCPIDY